MEGAFWHELLDGVARLHGVNSRQRRDQQDRGGDGENDQLFTGEFHLIMINLETVVLTFVAFPILLRSPS